MSFSKAEGDVKEPHDEEAAQLASAAEKAERTRKGAEEAKRKEEAIEREEETEDEEGRRTSLLPKWIKFVQSNDEFYPAEFDKVIYDCY